MMKKVLTLAAVAALAITSANAQRNCSADDVHQHMMNDANYARTQQQVEEHTARVLNSGRSMSALTGTVTIPVVVHVLYANSSQNLSNAQIQSQIDVLNEDFGNYNADAGNVDASFAGLQGDAQIVFVLDQIIRKQVTSGKYRRGFSTNDDMKKTSKGGSDPVSPDTKMNLWSCDIKGGILGYAQFPGGPASTDGIVVDYAYFGRGGSAQAPFDLGRTGTHEVGHYLNLRHIWGDGGCGATDFVADTPDSDGPNYGCATGNVACGTLDNYENFMDYTDDRCMVMFTQGQIDRMRAIFEVGGPRAAMAGNGANLTSGELTDVNMRDFGIEEFGFNVYPNPANSNATLRFSTPVATEVAVRIIDMRGAVINSFNLNVTDGIVERTVDVSGLNAGLYTIQVSGEGINMSQRLAVK